MTVYVVWIFMPNKISDVTSLPACLPGLSHSLLDRIRHLIRLQPRAL